MPFKVRCRVAAFLGKDAEKFPCGFKYKIGDEFIFDGEQFIGRVCPYFLKSALPVITAISIAGNKYCERHYLRYVFREPGVQDAEEAARVRAGLPPQTERGRGLGYACPDPRTIGYFAIEPVGLVESGITYQRQMSIVEKVNNEPGLTPEEILNRFSRQEREKAPLLHRTLVEIMMEELADANYIELKERRAYPKSS